MSNWIEHVKAYAKANNVPYKQAMSEAKSSYQPVEGGKFNLKKVGKTLNKVKKGAKKVSNVIDKNSHYLNYIDSDLANEVNNVNKGFKDISGGK
jgi:t-SNARE complex subunit (syntaxin)